MVSLNKSMTRTLHHLVRPRTQSEAECAEDSKLALILLLQSPLLSWQRRMTVLLEEDALPASLRLTHLVDLAWAMHQLLNCCHTISHFPTWLWKPRTIEDKTNFTIPSYKSLKRYVSINTKLWLCIMHKLAEDMLSCNSLVRRKVLGNILVRAPIELKLRAVTVTFHFFRLEYRDTMHL